MGALLYGGSTLGALRFRDRGNFFAFRGGAWREAFSLGLALFVSGICRLPLAEANSDARIGWRGQIGRRRPEESLVRLIRHRRAKPQLESRILGAHNVADRKNVLWPGG